MPDPRFPPSQRLPPTPTFNVHQARYDPAGIEYLKQTGQFRAYMQASIDSKNRPFLAWDGEGWTDSNLDHHYMLFGNSTGTRIHAPQLTSLECLELILKEGAANPGAIHVIYGGGYDTTMWCRDLPADLRVRLRDNNTVYWNVRAAPGVTPNTFRINYLPHKWTTIHGYDWYSHKWVTVKIYDVMTYFQTSFIKALESREIPVSDEITTGKGTRADFQYEDIGEVWEYMQQEVEALVMLADTLRGEIQDAGIYVTQWHGPATIAKALFKRNHIRDHMQTPSPEIERAAQYSYFGGHFEQYQAGHHPEPVYLADLNSAYPAAIRNLPTLRGASWVWVDEFTGETGMWLCGYDDIHQDHYAPHPTPWRGTGGQVGFPTTNTETWLWTPEASIPGVTVRGGYVLRGPYGLTDTERYPFRYIDNLYQLRLEWKRLKRGGEKALKLGANSSYGTMAQRIGGDPNKNGGRPVYHQLEWAGLVTSTVRRWLWDAIAQNPAAVIAVETDSIMTTTPIHLDIGDGLGQWGLKQYDWVTYIQNGIYFTSPSYIENGVRKTDEGTGLTRSKTRGINAKELQHGEVLDYLAGDQLDPLLVSYRRFHGLGSPSRHLYGQWDDGTKDVRVAGNKRIHTRGTCTACQQGVSMAEGLHPLTAAPHYGHTSSTPHPLPWLGQHEDVADDGIGYVGDAVEEYDVARRQK